MKKMLVFTQCYANELPFANLLYQSLKRHNPTLDFKAVMIDAKQEKWNKDFSFELLWIEDFGISEFQELASKYTWKELKNNCKPFVINRLLKKNSSVLYLDCTTEIFDSLEEIQKIIEEKSFILVPQFVEARPFEGENDALNKGIYHNGLMAFRQCEETEKMLRWWQNHTLTKGFERLCEGMNTDRLSLEFAPIFFENGYILKHKGYNVGNWNESERGFVQNKLATEKLITYNHQTDVLAVYPKDGKKFAMLRPAFGIPVKTLSRNEQKMVTTLDSILHKIDAFFDRF